MKKLKPLTATSFSRYKVHATCPRQAKYKFIDKLPEPKGPAMARGNVIHKGIERYLLRHAPKLPKDDGTDYGPLKSLYASIRKEKPAVELELAVDREWHLVDWFDPRVWFRAKVDGAVLRPKERVLFLFDNKTGKERPAEHAEQLETYIAIAPARWSTKDYDTIIASMLYTDHGRDVPAEYGDLKRIIAKLRKKWEKKLAPLLKDRTFKPTPGDHCKWCAYSGRKGGPCDAG